MSGFAGEFNRPLNDFANLLHRPVESTPISHHSRRAAIGPECVKTLS